MGNQAPTDAEADVPPAPPPWQTIPSGGYLTLLHQPASGRPEDPAVIPLPPSKNMCELAWQVRQARWPRGVPEFDDEIERYESVAYWLTMRGVACLTLLAKGAEEPPREMLDPLLATPFGFCVEDYDDPTQQPAEPLYLRQSTTELGRLILTHLANRVRSVLDPGAALIRPVSAVTNLVTAAVFAHDPHVDGAPDNPHLWRLRQEYLRTELAAALMSAWHVQPQLRVPLACAYAVQKLLDDWVTIGVSNTDIANADLPTAVHMRLQRHSGPDDLGAPVPEWARGLLASNQRDGNTVGDIEAWHA